MNEQHSARPTGPERRAAPRLPSELKVSCCPVGALLTERRRVRLRNVSCQGVALIADRPWGPGTTLSLDLPLGERPTPTRARVVHSTAQAGGSFLIGCIFESALTEEQIVVLTSGGPPVS
jgi:hypothetical protein